MLGSIFFLYIQDETMNLLEASRNFYGVLKVKETNNDNPSQQAYILKHSATIHGFQYTEEVNSHKPTTYYTERSGVGLAILHHPKREAGLRIGIIGLGVGTLAAYGRMDDTIRFYEINPDVIRLAEGAGGYFSYLKDCQAQVEVVQGDARISLEQELNIDEPQHFDLLIIDAFSSVSIPIHLLTKEAFNIYLQHLQPDGVLAFHISHRHLDLWPVIWKIADYFQLNTALIDSTGYDERHYGSTWTLVTRNKDFLNLPSISKRMKQQKKITNIRLWTDGYSNLFRILK
jgi:spermidine synthase